MTKEQNDEVLLSPGTAGRFAGIATGNDSSVLPEEQNTRALSRIL
jgi:hypothetical protein